jgi:hypothetical protein
MSLLFMNLFTLSCEAFLSYGHKLATPNLLRDFRPLLPAQIRTKLAPSYPGARPFGCMRAKVRMSVLNVVGDDFVGIQQGDVVKFSENDGHKSVGFVESLHDDGSAVLIRLVKREGLGNECYLDESQPRLRVNAIDCLIIDAYPSQRVAWSSASPHFNPHGCLCCVNSVDWYYSRICVYDQVKKARIVGSLMQNVMLT